MPMMGLGILKDQDDGEWGIKMMKGDELIAP